MPTPDSITIRVYGLLIHNKQVLLSKENIFGEIYTKFPGGGLELGEGVADCLQREFMEETGISLSRWELTHINEGFLASSFHRSKQVLSIYYRVWSEQVSRLKIGDPLKTETLKNHSDQILYWADLDKLKNEPIHLPIDQEVIKLLSQTFNNQ